MCVYTKRRDDRQTDRQKRQRSIYLQYNNAKLQTLVRLHATTARNIQLLIYENYSLAPGTLPNKRRQTDRQMCGFCVRATTTSVAVAAQVLDSLFTAKATAQKDETEAVGYFMNNKWESIMINHSRCCCCCCFCVHNKHDNSLKRETVYLVKVRSPSRNECYPCCGKWHDGRTEGGCDE